MNMITNLFSIFDPSTSMGLSLNWMSLFIILLIVFPCYWLIPRNMNMFFSNIVNILHKEIKVTLGKTTPLGTSIFLISILIFIIHNNVIGLLPYIFTASRHMTITLTLALPFWISLILFGWINSAINILAHLVPQGTPAILMMFMVLIETISNLIRPLTLAVRLTANIIAGHLLITLIGNQAAVSSLVTLIGVINAFILLTILEIAVAFIQAYVFAVLLTLYVNEIHH